MRSRVNISSVVTEIQATLPTNESAACLCVPFATGRTGIMTTINAVVGYANSKAEW